MNPAHNPAETKQFIDVLIQHWPILLFMFFHSATALVVIIYFMD